MAVLLSVQEQLERVGWGRFQMIAMTAFVLFLVSDGMELVVTNIIWQDLPLATWGVERNASGERGKLVSMAFSGFVLGAFISALVGDVIGRRPLIFLHGGIFVPCSLLSAASDSLPQLGASRFAVGVSMGLVLPCVNSLMAEFSPIAFRAKAVISIPGVAYSLGQVTVLLLGIALIRYSGSSRPAGMDGADHACTAPGGREDWIACEWWRGMLMAGIIPDIIALAIVYFYVPESPRFLICKGKSEQVRDALLQIARCNGVEDALADEGHCMPVADGSQDSGWEAYLDKALLRPPLSTLLVLTTGLWCSIAVVLFGGSLLFPIYLEQYLELSREQSYWLMLFMAVVEIPGIFVVFTVIDRPDVGRRRTMMLLTGASAIFALVLTFIWRDGVWALFGGNLLMRAVGALPYEIMYVYTAEVLPTSHRNTGLSLGQGASKIIASTLPLVLLPLVREPHPTHAALSPVHGGDDHASSLSLLFSGFPAQTLVEDAANSVTNSTTVSSAEAEAQPLDDSAGGHGGDKAVHAGAAGSRLQEDVSGLSIPYLILCVSACIATAMVYGAPEGNEAMFDTVAQADEALDSARGCDGRRSSLVGSEPERRPLVSPSVSSSSPGGQGGEGQSSIEAQRVPVGLYRPKT